MKLSKTMERCLRKLDKKKWKSSYELRESLNTLQALRARGLAISLAQLGSFAFPRVSLLWRLKN